MVEGEERELEEQLGRRNYAAAVALAQRLEKPPETIRELQEAAIKQYITEYRNAPGAMDLLGQFRFTAQELERLLNAILQEASRAGQERPSWAKKRYDAKAMKYLDIEEWISQYGAAIKGAASP